LLAAVGAIAIAGGRAEAERAQDGNLIVSLNGGITPRALPRQRPAPVSVQLAGRVVTTDRTPLPRVNWIRLQLAWRGVLDTHGLPVCPRVRLIGADTRTALRRCVGAQVGRGRLYAEIFVPHQAPFELYAKLIAFNGRTGGGRPAVLIQAYSTEPPVSFTIPFSIHHEKGSFRTTLVALIRRNAGPWPHVANFEINVSRRFNHDGRRRSYLKASCPVPKHFTAGFLSFARATYSFAGGKQLTTESVRSCRAR
jgi:hypothetical protein